MLALAAAAVTGCTQSWDSVCDSLGACAHGGDYAWIAQCQTNVGALRSEADATPCAGLFINYFGCVNSNFQCAGATPSFPACDNARSILEQCLAQAQSVNPCATYALDVGACPGADGGALVPAACSLSQQCQAHCYLSNVANACAPDLASLSAAAACAQACP